MKQLVSKLFIALFIALAFTALTLVALHINYSRSASISVKKEIYFEDGAHNNLVLGSSHTFYGLNAGLLGKKWFNFACVSQGINEDLGILKYLNSKGVQLDTVIISLDLFTNTTQLHLLSDGGESVRSFAYGYSFHIKYQYPDLDMDFRKHLVYFKVLSNYFISSPLSFFMQGAKRSGFANSGDLVIYPPVTSTYTLEQDAIEAVKRHISSTPSQVLSPGVTNMLSYCNQHKIKIYFIAMPATPYYISAMKKRGVYGIYLSNISAVEKMGYKVFNCLSSLSDLKYFRDSDHLNKTGRDYFSLSLNDSLAVN